MSACLLSEPTETCTIADALYTGSISLLPMYTTSPTTTMQAAISNHRFISAFQYCSSVIPGSSPSARVVNPYPGVLGQCLLKIRMLLAIFHQAWRCINDCRT